MLIAMIVSKRLVQSLLREAGLVFKRYSHKSSKAGHALEVHTWLTNNFRDVNVVLLINQGISRG